MKKFCYKCGALEEEKGPFIDGLCSDCFLEENELIRGPDELEIEICNTCGAYRMGNSIYDVEKNPRFEYLEAAKDIVSSKTEVLQKDEAGTRYLNFGESEGVDIGFQAEYSSTDTITVDLEARAKFFDEQEERLTDRMRVAVKIKEMTCDVCSKRSQGYYEALLQIRGEDELSEEKLSKIVNRLGEEFTEIRDRQREEFVSKVKKKHGGLNLYTSTSKLAEDMGRFLKKEYGAQTDQSAELIGQTDDGEEKYRVTVVARIPSARPETR